MSINNSPLLYTVKRNVRITSFIAHRPFQLMRSNVWVSLNYFINIRQKTVRCQYWCHCVLRSLDSKDADKISIRHLHVASMSNKPQSDCICDLGESAKKNNFLACAVVADVKRPIRNNMLSHSIAVAATINKFTKDTWYLPSCVRYRVYIVGTFEKIDRVITGPRWISSIYCYAMIEI